MTSTSQYRGISTLICLALSPLACDLSEPEPETLRSSEEIVAAACPTRRQVAVRHPLAPQCPSVTGWTASSVFAEGPGVLDEFCRYQWNDPKTTPNVEALTAAPGLLSVGSDCEVVFEQTGADALWDVIGSHVQTLFHQAIGRATASDLGLPGSETSRWPVVVAVVDSVPEPAPAHPRSEHGERMVDLIEDVACPDPMASCAVQVRRSLGLPRYGTGQIDTDRGGYFGSQIDLAQGIYAAVEDWRTTNWGTKTPKLIINLSVAWEGELFGDLPDPTPTPAVAAVHAAIEYAYCHGALIIAAAGNRGYPCTDGPLLPAGWEQQASPDANRCAELGAPTAPSGGPYRPLVYSVGGIDHDAQPMPGTREDGVPRLVAPSTHAVAGGNSMAMTGTSVASAVTAGTAALVWSYNKDLKPAGVMNAVYASADPLSWQADYVGPNASQTGVRRVNACAALEFACNLPNASCPASPFASPLACLSTPMPVTIEDLFAELYAVRPDHGVVPTFGPEVACPGTCGAQEVGYVSNSVGGANPCPVAVDQAQAFTLPQPTQIGCPNCTLDPIPAIVHASIDPIYDSADILDVTVTVSDEIGQTHYRLGALALSSTEITRIQLDPALMPATVREASISLTFDTQPRPVVNALLIGVR